MPRVKAYQALALDMHKYKQKMPHFKYNLDGTPAISPDNCYILEMHTDVERAALARKAIPELWIPGPCARPERENPPIFYEDNFLLALCSRLEVGGVIEAPPPVQAVPVAANPVQKAVGGAMPGRPMDKHGRYIPNNHPLHPQFHIHQQ